MNAVEARAYNRDRVLRALTRQSDPVQVRTLMSALNLSRGVVLKHLDDLINEGLVVRTQHPRSLATYAKAR